MTELLEVRDLSKAYPTRRNVFGRPTAWAQVVRNVSFSLAAGETLALVGETGAGKSTVGRLILRLIKADHGTVALAGRDVLAPGGWDVRSLRRSAAMIFQDPYTSFDPRMTVGRGVGEPLTIHFGLHGAEREDRVASLIDSVGLDHQLMDRYPHELSGGQLQRLAIARAISTDPKLIVCDEPVAALDVSIRAQVINLLLRLQSERGIGYLFISHDLALLRLFADRVAVMSHGQIVEVGSTEELFEQPQDPYTRDLISAIPKLEPGRRRAARNQVISR